MLLMNKFKVGLLGTNCYFIKDKDSGECALIDPGSKSRDLTQKVLDEKNNIKYILLTHGHFDHIRAVMEYKKLTNAKIVIYKSENEFLSNEQLNLAYRFTKHNVEKFNADILLDDNDVVYLGNTPVRLIFTPGHTYGSCCYIVDDIIFTGDTLMKKDIGRTDLATGDYSKLKQSLIKILNLERDYVVCPGHGDDTSISYERANNPYIGDRVNDTLY